MGGAATIPRLFSSPGWPYGRGRGEQEELASLFPTAE